MEASLSSTVLGESRSNGLGGSQTQEPRMNSLSNKISSVLATSYTDSEFRNALDALDRRKEAQSLKELRQTVPLDAQKDVIEQNGRVLQDFGLVAEQLENIGKMINKLDSCCVDMRRYLNTAQQESRPVLGEATTLLAQKREIDDKARVLGALSDHFVLSSESHAQLTDSALAINDSFFPCLERAKQIHNDCEILLGNENQRLGTDLMESITRDLDLGYQKLYRWLQQELKGVKMENPQINLVARKALRALSERPMLFQNCLDMFSDHRDRTLSDGFYSALTGISAASAPGQPAPSSFQRPIDSVAHDPLRYLGDMLAWIHSIIVSEHENLESLFIGEGEEIKRGLEAGQVAEPWSSSIAEGDNDDKSAADASVSISHFDGRETLLSVINRSTLGICRILKQKAEQMFLQFDEDMVLLYKMCHVLTFYQTIFTPLLIDQHKSTLLKTLADLQTTCYEQFTKANAANTVAVTSSFTAPTPDMQVPELMRETLSKLSDLITSYESSLAPRPSSLQEQQDLADRSNNVHSEDFPPVLGESLDPILDVCRGGFVGNHDVSSVIFILNCVLASQAMLGQHKSTKAAAEDLEAEVDDLQNALVDDQYNFFIHTAAIYPLYNALESMKDQYQSKTMDSSSKPHPASKSGSASDSQSEPKSEPKSESESELSWTIHLTKEIAFRPNNLEKTSAILDDFLPIASMDAVTNLKAVADKTLVQRIVQDAAERFCQDFETIEKAIIAHDEAVMRKTLKVDMSMVNGNADAIEGEDESEDEDEDKDKDEDDEFARVMLRPHFPRTSDEVRVLLS